MIPNHSNSAPPSQHNHGKQDDGFERRPPRHEPEIDKPLQTQSQEWHWPGGHPRKGRSESAPVIGKLAHLIHGVCFGPAPERMIFAKVIASFVHLQERRSAVMV